MKLLRHSQRPGGSAVVAILVILSILGIFVVANAKRLHQLNQELKIVERRQIERYHTPPTPAPSTNPPASRDPH